MSRIADVCFGMWIYKSGRIDRGVQIYFDELAYYYDLHYSKEQASWICHGDGYFEECLKSPNNCRHTRILNELGYLGEEELIHSRCNACNKYFINPEYAKIAEELTSNSNTERNKPNNTNNTNDVWIYFYKIDLVLLSCGHLCCKKCKTDGCQKNEKKLKT